MLAIRFVENPKSLPAPLRRSVEAFLKETIPQGTVVMPPSVYDGADTWSLLLDGPDVLGFASHRYFDLPGFTLVQIGGTFLSPSVRGGAMVGLLVGPAHLRALARRPLAPIWQCSRTRNPAAFSAAHRSYGVFPKLDPAENASMAPFAEYLAKTVYGPRVSLDHRTFLMRDSYPEDGILLRIQNKRQQSPIVRFFDETVDYERNECILMVSRVTPRMMRQYAWGRLRFELASRLGRLRRPLPAPAAPTRRA